MFLVCIKQYASWNLNSMSKKDFLKYGKIDHIAIAVNDLESAVWQYTTLFNFSVQKRRSIEGQYSGMNSAELDAGEFSIVLVEAKGGESQIARYINAYGTGVQHIAIEVSDLRKVAADLTDKGTEFATDIIEGNGLLQIFTQRDTNTGMMFEFIERNSVSGFEKGNIQQLFNQLEDSNAY